MTLAWALSGCHLVPARVKIEPVNFNHPEEILKGTGPAEGYWAMADRRIFAVMAFLNAAGYDSEVSGCQMHPLRVQVRQKVMQNLAPHPEKLRAWRKYYHQHLWGSWYYANFALSLNADYPFHRIRPARELYPRIAAVLADFPEVLNDFWVTAELDQVWTDFKPAYLAEVQRYSPERMAQQMGFLWQYLRMTRPDHRIIIQVPNPLQRSATANANRLEKYFYSVDGPNSNGGGLNVHEYLHTVMNDLVKRNYSAAKRKLRPYYNAGKDAQISATLRDPVTWSTECLIHALDHRVAFHQFSDPAIKKSIEARVDELTKSGYTLLKPLYEALLDFEQSGQSFDKYLPLLLANLPDFYPSTATP